MTSPNNRVKLIAGNNCNKTLAITVFDPDNGGVITLYPSTDGYEVETCFSDDSVEFCSQHTIIMPQQDESCLPDNLIDHNIDCTSSDESSVDYCQQCDDMSIPKLFIKEAWGISCHYDQSNNNSINIWQDKNNASTKIVSNGWESDSYNKADIHIQKRRHNTQREYTKESKRISKAGNRGGVHGIKKRGLDTLGGMAFLDFHDGPVSYGQTKDLSRNQRHSTTKRMSYSTEKTTTAFSKTEFETSTNQETRSTKTNKFNQTVSGTKKHIYDIYFFGSNIYHKMCNAIYSCSNKCYQKINNHNPVCFYFIPPNISEHTTNDRSTSKNIVYLIGGITGTVFLGLTGCFLKFFSEAKKFYRGNEQVETIITKESVRMLTEDDKYLTNNL
ncbi:MAG: hypothetical protein QS748_04580 [Candidatus Endonucleobacter bathymodioli]|uniref:Uncharacterized protein n=1 Tax=Candidatus Endonucleibacter bathymodioli TaxID=539814 RepID=A0AA90NKY1_9GAMM|nr:hypothetical protein [Candidatus Endonucleobacter bathymodioli]